MITIVPFSSWIEILEISGSVSRRAAEEVSEEGGRAASSVPFARRGV